MKVKLIEITNAIELIDKYKELTLKWCVDNGVEYEEV